MDFSHKPVMADEIRKLAQETPGRGIIIDATLGGAGHAEILLNACPNRNLIGFDRDSDAISFSKKKLEKFSDRVELIHAGFAEIKQQIEQREIKEGVGIVLFDLGVSSHQLDTKGRGFTYRHDDAPLDMRMDSRQELTAEEIVNTYSQEDLERIIRENSDEKFSRSIAREIVAARPLKNAGDLVSAIRRGMPHRFQRISHPAKRTFQALRMEVNRELEQLKVALDESVHLLSPGGRVLVLSYHSGEDKLVKSTLDKYMTKTAQTPDGRVIPEVEQASAKYESQVRLLPIGGAKKPSRRETSENPRSKSVRLRAAQRDHDGYNQASGM